MSTHAITSTLSELLEGVGPEKVNVSVLTLQPGDTLVLMVPGVIAESALADLRETMTAQFPDNHALVLTGGMRFGIIRPTP